MATLSPAARPATQARHRRRLWLLIITIAFMLAAVIGFYFISANWPYRYRNIRPMLEDDLAGQVEFTSYHRIYFPHPGFVATGLTLRRKSALNLPPLGHAERMMVEGRWRDLLLLRQRVQTVEVTGLHIVVPPIGSQANHANFPPGSSSDFTGPDTALEMFKIHNSILEIMRNDGRRLDLLRCFATDAAIPLRPRAAACIMLLYAQPLTRVLRLADGDLTRDDDGQAWLNLGDPPSPVRPRSTNCSASSPPPAMTTSPSTTPAPGCSPAARPDSPPTTRAWPSSSATTACPCAPRRVAALRQLVLQVPAPVIADALGFHHTTTTRQHLNAGAPWSNYVGGDRSSPADAS